MSSGRKASPEAPKTQISWKAIFRSQEVDIFLLGLLCALLLVAWTGYLQSTHSAKAGQMLAAISTHLMLGRAAGVSTITMGRHFSRLETVMVGSLVESAVVCLFFSAFCLSCKKLIHVPWLDSAVRNVHASARKQRHRLLRWGIPGLILFVWFPFMMTGPVVGSVIGFLLGMRPWIVIATVMGGTISAIVSWTFLMGALDQWMQRVGDYAPAAAVLTILTVIICVRIHNYQLARQKGRRKAGGEEPPDGDGGDPSPPPPGPGNVQNTP